MLKAKPVSNPSALETTYLYVLNGWACRVEFEVELQDPVIKAIIADATPNNYQVPFQQTGTLFPESIKA